MNLSIPIHVANDWSVNKDLDPAIIKFMLKRLYHATIESHVIHDMVFFTITIIDIYFRRIENMTKRLFALMIWNKTENRFNKQRYSVMRSWKWRQWKYNFVQIWKYFKLIEKHLLQYRILYQRRIFASYINEFSRFWSDNLARGFTNKTITSQFEKCVV